MRHSEWPSLAGAVHLEDYPINVRWTDMDLLQHVNNVMYVQMADNARFAAAGVLDAPVGRASVASCQIDFIDALESRTDPTRVVSAVRGMDLYQEIRSIREGSEVTHARLHISLADPAPFDSCDSPGHDYLHWTRPSDARDGEVTNHALFGILQEARILALDRGEGLLDHERVVVARSSLRVARPVLDRPEPYLVRTYMKRLGTSSTTLVLQLRDGSDVLAEGESVVVGFDLRTARSRPFTETERSSLLRALPLAVVGQ